MEYIKFSASWCGPCKMLSETLKSVDPQITLKEVDVDNDEEGLCAKYQIRGVPTVVAVEDGKEVKRFTGAQSLAFLNTWFK